MAMTDTVSSLWGQTAAAKQAAPLYGWLDPPLVQELYVKPLTGAAGDHWLRSQVERLGLPRTGRWLSIGCGNGELECFAAEEGLCAEIVGIDIAPAAVALANDAAAAQGLSNASFRVADLNHSRISERYDVILCAMGLHHLRRLEFVYEEAARALVDGGWLLLNEFVGPSQWQWTDAQLAATNTLLAALPQRLRIHCITGEVKERVERPTLEYMNRVDPSESVRSAAILPLLRQQFAVQEELPYGGAVLHELLAYIGSNFAPEREEDVALLRLLCAAEQALTKAGALADDFVLLAAQNQRHSLRRSTLPLDAALERHVVSGIDRVETGPEGTRFCWAAPTTEVVLLRHPGATTLGLTLALPPVAGCLTITVDDVVVGTLRSLATGAVGSWQQVAFGLPPSVATQAAIRLEFDQPWSPHAAYGNGDERVLGVAISDLRLR